VQIIRVQYKDMSAHEVCRRDINKQVRQCTYDVTSRRVRDHCCRVKAINITYLCACVRACAWRAWVCACLCLHVALLIQHATCMRYVLTSFLAPVAPFFSTLSYKWHDFRKKSY
jgi:hypothetical protein